MYKTIAEFGNKIFFQNIKFSPLSPPPEPKNTPREYLNKMDEEGTEISHIKLFLLLYKSTEHEQSSSACVNVCHPSDVAKAKGAHKNFISF